MNTPFLVVSPNSGYSPLPSATHSADIHLASGALVNINDYCAKASVGGPNSSSENAEGGNGRNYIYQIMCWVVGTRDLPYKCVEGCQMYSSY